MSEKQPPKNVIRDFDDFIQAMSTAVGYVTDTDELVRVGRQNPNIERIGQLGRQQMQDLATRYPDMWQKYQTAYSKDNSIIANFKLPTL